LLSHYFVGLGLGLIVFYAKRMVVSSLPELQLLIEADYKNIVKVVTFKISA